MINFNAPQAQLLRLLSEFFGEQSVIPQMSIAAVFADCNSESQDKLTSLQVGRKPDWSKTEKCLFTVVDPEGCPKLIVELHADDGSTVDLIELDKQEQLDILCAEAKIHFVVIDYQELYQILDPSSGTSLLSVLSGKVLSSGTVPLGFGNW